MVRTPVAAPSLPRKPTLAVEPPPTRLWTPWGAEPLARAAAPVGGEPRDPSLRDEGDRDVVEPRGA